jgi:hypothetical protein
MDWTPHPPALSQQLQTKRKATRSKSEIYAFLKATVTLRWRPVGTFHVRRNSVRTRLRIDACRVGLQD